MMILTSIMTLYTALVSIFNVYRIVIVHVPVL
jgi:hypothetical protein